MLGLSADKIVILGILAAVVLGPERLPYYASQLANFIRNLRGMTNTAKTRLRSELGPDFDDVDWKKLDPRQYNPRNIIRAALSEDPAAAAVPEHEKLVAPLPNLPTLSKPQPFAQDPNHDHFGPIPPDRDLPAP